jgi:hypothetical protein
MAPVPLSRRFRGDRSPVCATSSSTKYFGVDLALVWDVVERELPVLRPQLEELSQRLADNAGPR